MSKRKLNTDLSSEEFKGLLELTFNYFGEQEASNETPDQALVWMFMVICYMVETMSIKDVEGRKQTAFNYLDIVHDIFIDIGVHEAARQAIEELDDKDPRTDAMEAAKDLIGRAMNKRAI